jgi:DNA repair protein RadA/Sms
MAKAKTRYVCQACGAVHPRWVGHCDSCNGWNSIVEEALPESAPLGAKVNAKALRNSGAAIDFVPLKGSSPAAPRRSTGMNEFDRVTGGGLVEGSAVLIGGDPGIGKSTLLLQVTAALAKTTRCIYISGEESIEQIRLRASRLEVANEPVQLATATNVRNILVTLDVDDPPDVVVIDSIQTMYIEGANSRVGTRTDPSSQEARFCSAPGRPCNKRRHHRRSTGFGAYGRHRALFRR